MANTARKDRKRLATTDERNPTKESTPEPRAKRKRTSAFAEAPKAAPPKRRRTLALKAMPADPERTAAAPNAVSAAPGALKIASPQATPTQETATQRTAAPLSASDLTPSGQAAPPPPARPAAANVTDGLRAQFPIPDAEALARNIGQAIEQGGEVLAAYLKPRETGEIKMNLAGDGGEMIRSIGQLGQYYMGNPLAAFEAQTALTTQFINLWASTLRRFLGSPAALAPARPLGQTVLRRGMARQSIL